MLRYFFDEHIDLAITRQLRQRGIDVQTALEAGRANQGITDADHLAFASSHKRIMVTQDRDYVQLAISMMPHAGIIMMQRALSISDSVDYLELMAHCYEADNIHNQLVFCDW